jgi:hypothetical protein
VNRFSILLLPAAVVALGSLLCIDAGQQSASAQTSPDVSNAPSLSAAAPQLPPNRSPIDFFRELLHQNPSERTQSLTNRSPESQKLILAKVREYESLSPEDCELRLRVTELHFYLVPLMNTPATNRAVQLAQIPSDTRKLVEDRLEQWDKLTLESQKDLLQNETTLRALSDMDPRSPEPTIAKLTEGQRAELEAGIRRWQGLSAEQRRGTVTRFQLFFELTEEEKQKVLGTLSEAERQQLDRTLDSFSKLTPLQRAQCVRSFEKFTSLSPDERQQFLKNAARWQALSPSQRQLWRDLVYNLSHQPPMPPAAGLPPVPPPGPGRLPPSPAGLTANTN